MTDNRFPHAFVSLRVLRFPVLFKKTGGGGSREEREGAIERERERERED